MVITDEDGTVIGIGEITIGEPGSGDFTVTTGENGSITVKNIKGMTPAKPVNPGKPDDPSKPGTVGNTQTGDSSRP